MKLVDLVATTSKGSFQKENIKIKIIICYQTNCLTLQ